MSLVIVIFAVAVVLVAVVFVAMGWGGELSVERPDYRPLDLGPVTATDVALLRPPGGLWGYNAHATDEALARIAASIRERDVRIVALEQRVADLSREPSARSPLSGSSHWSTANGQGAGDGPRADDTLVEPAPDEGDDGTQGSPEQPHG